MAGLTQLMFGCGCNILSSAQYVNEDGIFFQRMSIDFSNAYCGGENRESLELSIENRERSIMRLNERVEQLQERVEYDEANFEQELDRQMAQALGELDAVQAARGR